MIPGSGGPDLKDIRDFLKIMAWGILGSLVLVSGFALPIIIAWLCGANDPSVFIFAFPLILSVLVIVFTIGMAIETERDR
jgi:hypothetical protein